APARSQVGGHRADDGCAPGAQRWREVPEERSRRLHDAPRPGIAQTTAALLGDLAPALSTWSYDERTHRLQVRTKFNDDYVVDVTSRQKWLAKEAPQAPETARDERSFERLEFIYTPPDSGPKGLLTVNMLCDG